MSQRSHTKECKPEALEIGRKSSEEGLEQDFNSLHAQREACEAFIKSQAGEGWRPIRTAYDDGGFSGGTMARPALQQLLEDIRQKRVDVIVVYKVDRLTRSLADFAKMVDACDQHGVSFVAVTQQFRTRCSAWVPPRSRESSSWSSAVPLTPTFDVTPPNFARERNRQFASPIAVTARSPVATRTRRFSRPRG